MSKYNVYVEDVSVEAVFNILGGVDGARRLLRGELVVSEPTCTWREENGVIHFTLTTDGTTGEQLITRLENSGKSVGGYAKSVLRSADFVPSPAGTVYKVVVLKGSLFTNNERTTANIRAEAERRGLIKPHAEVACLIRDMFTNDDIKAMGLWRIVAMHDPIEDSGGDPRLLGADRGDSAYSLSAFYAYPDIRCNSGRGFAFLQV